MDTKLDSLIRVVTPTGDEALAGQGMVEYALILVFIAVACVAIVTLLGDAVLALWDVIEVVIGGALSLG